MIFNKADFIASYGISSQLPESDRPELSFSGRSNVGKSSLINKLCSRKNLARVSSTPGKTATINFYSVDGAPQAVPAPKSPRQGRTISPLRLRTASRALSAEKTERNTP
jgi:GTP-binding protein EngB required for normal cell division